MSSQSDLSKTWTDFPTGLSSSFLFFQSAILVIFTTWALGGRLEGALPWIGGLASISILSVFLDPNRSSRWRAFAGTGHGQLITISLTLLLLVLLLAPFNAIGFIDRDESRNVRFVAQDYLPWLPATLVVDRCREFGILLSGLLIQCAMLWLYLNRFSRIERLLKVITVNAMILALIGAGFRLIGSEKILGLAEPVHPEFFASFYYHNHWTAYAVLAMGCCLALICFALKAGRMNAHMRRQRPEIFWAGGLFLLSLTLPMTTARAGVLLLALFWLYLGAVLMIRTLGNRDRAKPRMKRLFLPITIFGIAVMIIGFAVWSSAPRLQADWEQTKQQWTQLQEGELGELDLARTDSWGDGWRMFKDSPIWGWGFGSHRYLYQLYARDEYRYPNGIVKHIKEFAHNDWMQFLAEFGVVGLFLLTAPACYVAWLTRRAWLRPESPSHWLIVAMALILFLATFEFPLSNPAVLVHFGILLTLALKIAWLDKNRLSRSEEKYE